VTFVIARDPRGRFQFGSLQSPAAASLIEKSAPGRTVADSVLLIDDGRVWMRSAAALRILRRLTFPWPLAYVFVVVPRPLRDVIYDLVASHRYRWFGRRAVCMVPTPEMRSRFID